MNVLAINGSPRKEWNTATLLQSALEGAKSQGADTEMIHLYDLDFKGCVSCFSCKRVGGKNYGRCALNDGLKPVLEKIERCGAFVVGSPVYLGDATGETRSFLERLVFQYLVYDKAHSNLFPGKIKTGLILTMNVPGRLIEEIGYGQRFRETGDMLGRMFGSSEPPLFCTETYQFDDYSKYSADGIDGEARAERRRTVFPDDCRQAFELGVRLAGRC